MCRHLLALQRSMVPAQANLGGDIDVLDSVTNLRTDTYNDERLSNIFRTEGKRWSERNSPSPGINVTV